MISINYRIWTALLLMMLIMGGALAQGIPNAISYQGKLINSSGQLLADGSYQIQFKLYDVSSGGTAFWTSSAQTVQTVGGVFSTYIQPLSAADLAGKMDVWLEVLVGGSALSPRARFASVPYALSSGNTWSLSGNSGTSPGTNFIGTTDNQSFEVRVNGLRAVLIEPASDPTYGAVPNVIGGWLLNSATAGVIGAFIGGGGGSMIGVGFPNEVTDFYGSVQGGIGNRAGNDNSSTTDAGYATVAGGKYNAAGGAGSTVAGGGYNNANALGSAIGGGEYNYVNGQYAVIPGGYKNDALGTYSFAAGYYAKANHNGAFVWSDLIGSNFASTANNQFLIKATGGVGIGTNSPQSTLHVNGTTTMIGLKLTTSPAVGYVLTSDASGTGTWQQVSVPDGSVTSAKIADGSVTSTKIADNSVTSVKIADNTITSSDLADGAIGSAKLADASVTSTKLVDASITSAKIADASVTSPKLADSSVTSAKIVDGTITSSDLAAGSVTGSKIADGVITSADIASTQIVKSVNGLKDDVTLEAGNNIIISNKLGALMISSPTDWKTTGNSGTTPGTNFIGTIDNQPLEFRVLNSRALRLEHAGNLSFGVTPNIMGGYSGNSVLSGVVGATIAGGGGFYSSQDQKNEVYDTFGTLSGGAGNKVGTNDQDFANSIYATISGGWLNYASGHASTISGGMSNLASGARAVVGGGQMNRATGTETSIGGGNNNEATASYSAVTGGYENIASGAYSFIGGGQGSTSTASHSTIAGGYGNDAQANYSVIGGGMGNDAGADGRSAVVAGGEFNYANGICSMIPGGTYNRAMGNFSFAAGRRAKANHGGCFVWGDDTDSDIASDAPNRFIVRSTNGAYFYSNAAKTAGLYLAGGGGSWSNLCDRNVKSNFSDVDPREVLEKLCGIPIQTWNYNSQDPSIRHMGPMAQDFYQVFGLGEDAKHINSVDTDGVALAAIQGLNQELKERDAKIADLQSQIDELKKLVIALSEKK